MIDFLKGTVTPRDWMAVGIMVAILAILIVVFVFVVHRSQVNKLAKIIQDNEQMKEDLQLALETKANVAGLEEQTEKIESLVSDFEERLPSRQEIPTLFKQFEEIGVEAGVENNVSQLPRERDARKETLPYNIEARGTFHQISSFINRLERFKRFVKISDLKLGPEDEGVSEAKFTLSTYRFLTTETVEPKT